MKPVSIPADKILECIQLYRDPDKRVSKKHIAYYLNLPYNTNTDRQIRDAVTELRKEGEPICSDSGRAGYYYNAELIDHTIAEYESRASEMFEIARAMKRGRANREVVQLGLM